MRSRRYPSLTEIAGPLGVREEEVAPVLWCAAYFFCVLFGYYLMRPVREAAGIEGGTEALPWLFLGTMILMLLVNPPFAMLVNKFPRRVFIPLTYLIAGVTLLIFAILFVALDEQRLYGLLSSASQLVDNQAYRVSLNTLAVVSGDFPYRVAGYAFYMWLSVLNLFMVSVFWQFMADFWRNQQSKRIFGIIGVGGTLGATLGSLTAAILSRRIESPAFFLLMAVFFIALACLCVSVLFRLAGIDKSARSPQRDPNDAEQDVQPAVHPASAEPTGGGFLSGVALTIRSAYLRGIGLYVLGITISLTALYFIQAGIVSSAFESSQARREAFGWIDTAGNLVTLAVQLFLTGRLIRWLGIGGTLASLPLFVLGGFVAMSIALRMSTTDDGAIVAGTGLIWTLVIFQALTRGIKHALAKPARETLFTLVDREERYKSKAFIDTFVYRLGDAGTSQAFYRLVNVMGMSVVAFAMMIVPVAGVWLCVALWLGRAQQQKLHAQETQTETDPQQS